MVEIYKENKMLFKLPKKVDKSNKPVKIKAQLMEQYNIRVKNKVMTF